MYLFVSVGNPHNVIIPANVKRGLLTSYLTFKRHGPMGPRANRLVIMAIQDSGSQAKNIGVCTRKISAIINVFFVIR